MRFPEALRRAVRRDYYDGELTVEQIAKKHSVARRTVYAWVGKGHNRKRGGTARGDVRMTIREMELVILALMEMDEIIDDDTKAVSITLQNRLADKADELRELYEARGSA